MLIAAVMSGCRGTDLIGSVNTVPMRLAAPKSFIDGLGEDAVKDAILRLIVDFSHTLGFKITAEGVENGRQVANLRPSVAAIRPKVHISRNRSPARQRRACGDKSFVAGAQMKVLP